VPSISLLRYGDDRAGSYCLILRASEDEVTVLRAGAIVVEVIPSDEFRRRWTGYALIVSDRHKVRRQSIAAVLSILGLGFVIGVRVGRRRKLHYAHDSTIPIRD